MSFAPARSKDVHMASTGPSAFGPSMTNPPFCATFQEPIRAHRELFERFEHDLGMFLGGQPADYDPEAAKRLQEEVAVLKGRSTTFLLEGLQQRQRQQAQAPK